MTNASGRKSTHWAVRKKERDEWHRLMGFIIRGYQKPEAPFKRARITLSRGSSRRPDLDGLVSGFKNTIDGFKGLGILEDDAYENIGIPRYRWGKTKKNEGFVHVMFEALPDEYDYLSIPFDTNFHNHPN